jgi:hypothetical protein
LAANFIYCPTLALRRASVGDSPFDESWRFVCDWDLTARLLLEGHALVGVNEKLLEYRRHPSQATARLTQDAQRFGEELAFLKQMAVRTEAEEFHGAARAARRRLATRSHVTIRVLLDALTGRRHAARLEAKLLWRDLRG